MNTRRTDSISIGVNGRDSLARNGAMLRTPKIVAQWQNTITPVRWRLSEPEKYRPTGVYSQFMPNGDVERQYQLRPFNTIAIAVQRGGHFVRSADIKR